MRSNDVLIVGQAPGRAPGEPLAGAIERLLVLTGANMRACDRVNLLNYFPGKRGSGDAFPLREARAAATMLERFAPQQRVVLLGTNVCRAFALHMWPCTTRGRDGRTYLHVPHPSGLNRWWNEAENRSQAAIALRRIYTPDPPA